MTSHPRSRASRLLGAVTSVALAVGFSAVAIAAPAHAATEDGVYVGENSHGYDFSITVEGGMVTDVATTAWIACGVPPIQTPLAFNAIPDTAIAADGSFSANWTYQIDADYSAEYWLGGVFHADGTVTSAGSNAADMIGTGLFCSGQQFTYEAAIDAAAPTISVSPNPATLSQITDPAGAVRITGAGFAPGSTVNLVIDGQQAAARTADAEGDVEVLLSWPNATVGDHTMRLVSGIRSAETTLTIIEDPTYNPTAAVDPATATVSRLGGAGVTVTGAGFPASVPVDIAFDGSVVSTVTSGTDGSLSYTLVHAGAAVGAHSITLTNGQWAASATLTVEADPIVYDPTAAVSPDKLTVSAMAAGGVQISGAEFPPNAPVSIQVAGEPVATVDSSGTGDVSYTYVKSGAAVAQYPVVLTSGQWSASSSFEVTADPIVYDPTVAVLPETLTQSALADTGVQVEGTGFPENAEIEVLFDGAVVSTATSSADGSVATTITRAGVGVGTSTVLLRSGQWEASDTIVVTADPIDPAEVTLSPTTIATGALETDGVDVTAEGLPADVPVRVLFDGVEVAAFTASATGTGSASFTIADAVPGAHTVRLVQGPGFAPGDVLGEAVLTVTEDPLPGDPQLVLSLSSIAPDALATTGVLLTGTGFTPGQDVSVFFDGQEVGVVTANAAGHVSYTLRVANAAPGAHPVALVQGDRSSEVTLTVKAAAEPGNPGTPGNPTQPGDSDGGGLATTGADAGLWAGVAGVALALMAAGGLILIRRRGVA
ncbi:hypothetical protein [Microbacterium sp. LWH12-1.2]|uniref:hypothetical protein n=1 Tax=Microbacterium sp. LWH12-1.2 TaxID=3135259 RepID=UPI00342CC921